MHAKKLRKLRKLRQLRKARLRKLLTARTLCRRLLRSFARRKRPVGRRSKEAALRVKAFMQTAEWQIFRATVADKR